MHYLAHSGDFEPGLLVKTPSRRAVPHPSAFSTFEITDGELSVDTSYTQARMALPPDKRPVSLQLDDRVAATRDFARTQMCIGVLLLLPELLGVSMQSTLLVASPALSNLGQTLLFGSVCILAFAFVLGRVSATIDEPVGPRIALTIFGGLVVVIGADLLAVLVWIGLGRLGGWAFWIAPSVLLFGLVGGVVCCRLAMQLDRSSQHGTYSPL